MIELLVYNYHILSYALGVLTIKTNLMLRQY